MAAVEHKAELFAHMLRLRRAVRSHPDDEDIVAVRAALERQLGDVLTRSRKMSDLRQSSPFAGTLSEAERRRIWELVA